MEPRVALNTAGYEPKDLQESSTIGINEKFNEESQNMKDMQHDLRQKKTMLRKKEHLLPQGILFGWRKIHSHALPDSHYQFSLLQSG